MAYKLCGSLTLFVDGVFFLFFFYPFSNFYFSKAPAEKSILHQAFPQRVSTELFSSVPFSEWASRWRLCTVQEKKKRNVAEIGSTFIFTQWIDPESWLVHKMPVKFCIYNGVFIRRCCSCCSCGYIGPLGLWIQINRLKVAGCLHVAMMLQLLLMSWLLEVSAKTKLQIFK